MKKIVILLSLLTSVQLMAETFSEARQRLGLLQDKITKDPSMDDLIVNIENGTFDPIFSFDFIKGLENEPGVSGVFNNVIFYRMKAEAQVGNVAENLLLLKSVIKKGVNVNLPQTLSTHAKAEVFRNRAYPLYPLMIASEVCSAPAIDLLLKNGASLTISDDLWTPALNSFNRLKTKSPEASNECRKISEFFLSRTQSFSANEAYKQLSYDFETNDVSFIGGDVVERNYSPEMLSIFSKKFNLKFSQRPSGDEPDDIWFEEFRKHLERPAINNPFDDRFKYDDWAKDWWSKQSTSLKSWACYYSTIDETIGLLIQGGADVDWLITRPSSGSEQWKFRGYGAFAVNTFRDYCNSLK